MTNLASHELADDLLRYRAAIDPMYETAHGGAAFYAAYDDALLEARIQAAWRLLASQGWTAATLADYTAARQRAGAAR